MAAAVQALDEIIKEYLLFRGFANTLKTFEAELKLDKDKSFRVNKIVEQLISFVTCYDLQAIREYWSYLKRRFFSRLDSVHLHNAYKLEKCLYRFYLVNAVQTSRADKVIDFFEKMAPELQNQADWKEWFVLPFLKSPEQNPSLEMYFSTLWQETFPLSLHNFLNAIFQSMPLPRLLKFDAERIISEKLKQDNNHLHRKITILKQEIAILQENKEKTSTVKDVEPEPRPEKSKVQVVKPKEKETTFIQRRFRKSKTDNQEKRKSQLLQEQDAPTQTESSQIKTTEKTNNLEQENKEFDMPHLEAPDLESNQSSGQEKSKNENNFNNPHSCSIQALEGNNSTRVGEFSSSTAGDFSCNTDKFSSEAGNLSSKTDDPASKSGDFASRAGDLASRAGDFAGKVGDFLRKSGDFTGKATNFSSKVGDFDSNRVDAKDKRSKSFSAKVTPRRAPMRRTNSGVPEDGYSEMTTMSSNAMLGENVEKPFLVLGEETFSEHRSAIVQCDFSPSGKMVSGVDFDGIVKIWKHQPSLSTVATIMTKSSILCTEWASKTDKVLLLGISNGKIRLYDTETKTTRCDLSTDSHHSRIISLACSPSGTSFVCSATTETKSSMSSVFKHALSTEQDRHTDMTTGQGMLLLWDLKTLKLERHLTLDNNITRINCIAYNHNGTLLVTGGADGFIRIYDTRSYDCLMSWSAHMGQVNSVEFSVDETSVFSLGRDDQFIQWSLRTMGHKTASLCAHDGMSGPRDHTAVTSPRAKPALFSRLFTFDCNGEYLLTCAPTSGIIYKYNESDSALSQVFSIGERRSHVTSVDWNTAVDCITCLTGSLNGHIRMTTLLRQ